MKSRRNPNRRRKPSYDFVKIAIGGVLLIIAILCVVLVVKTRGKKTEESTEESTTVVETTELQKEVMVEGVSITGLSFEEAREALLKKYPWSMKVLYEGKEPYEISNLIEEKIDSLLQEIYAGTGNQKDQYTLDVTGLDESVASEAAKIAKQWDVPAKNGSIFGFDKSTNKFIYSGEQTGHIINQEKLITDIHAALAKKEFDASIKAEGKDVAPEISEAQAKEMYQVIGTYTTTTTSNKDRNTNIQLAADALNGLIIQPGEEFSFNETTGNRTTDKGYRPAGAYQNGILVEEPGGGVCQVSSTLYNAVVFSGLTTTERHPHSYEPSYVTPGEDAMVSYDGYSGPDMKFVNNSPSAVAIRAQFADRKLKISIVGIPILEEGVELSMHSEKTGELDPPAPTYEEDQTLQPGVEVESKKAKNGSRWITNLVTKKNGTVISDEFFHSSTYKGKAAVIKRNTSGVVIPAESDGSSVPVTDEQGSIISPSSGGGESSSSSPGGEPTSSGQNGTAPGENPTQAPGPDVQPPESSTANIPPHPGESATSSNQPVGPGM